MAVQGHGHSGTPPGWYPDPHQPGIQRYWDGVNWTAHTSATSQATWQPTESNALQTTGYVLAGASVLIPFLALGGLIIGIIVATKPGKGGHGGAIISLSLVVGIIAFVVWARIAATG